MCKENLLTKFTNEEFGEIRVITIDEEPMFIGKELVEKLGYKKNYCEVIKQHCDEDDYLLYNKNSSKKWCSVLDYKTLGQRGGYLVNESGVIKLIQKSEVKSSGYKENFKRWLISEKLIKDKFVIKSRKEINFLDKLEKVLEPFGYECIRQYSILNYKIDLYIKDINIAIEYDENGHANYTYEAHEGRQKEIEKELGCKFIRVTDKENDLYNIGLVMKGLVA